MVGNSQLSKLSVFKMYIISSRVLLNPTPTNHNVTLVVLSLSTDYHFYKMKKIASLAYALFNKCFVPALRQALC